MLPRYAVMHPVMLGVACLLQEEDEEEWWCEAFGGVNYAHVFPAGVEKRRAICLNESTAACCMLYVVRECGLQHAALAARP